MYFLTNHQSKINQYFFTMEPHFVSPGWKSISSLTQTKNKMQQPMHWPLAKDLWASRAFFVELMHTWKPKF